MAPYERLSIPLAIFLLFLGGVTWATGQSNRGNDGRFAGLKEANRYHAFLTLNLSDPKTSDVIEYLLSL